jgi:hypothetical protein
MRKAYQKPQTRVYDFQSTRILCMSGDEDLYYGPFGQVSGRNETFHLA